jgi:hypothetical protein
MWLGAENTKHRVRLKEVGFIVLFSHPDPFHATNPKLDIEK